MRYFLITLFVCSLAFSAAFNGAAVAQRHIDDCDQADSTADAFGCVNRRNQDIQEKLNQVFEAIIATQDEETKAMLGAAQKNWIIYRDAQCEWESGLTDTASLKRVYELSCLASMTERRVKLLESVQMREKETSPREFGAQPRWMNALAHDYPDIFWRYGEWQSADMDCDDEDEQIMTGLSVARIQDSVTIGDDEVAEDAHHEVEIVIAVSENPKTGRPKATLFRLPVSDKYDGAHLCRPAINLEVIDDPSKSDEVACGKALQINDKSCEPLIIYWDGSGYVLKTNLAESEAEAKIEGGTL